MRRRSIVKWLSFFLASIVVGIPVLFGAYLYRHGYPHGQVSSSTVAELSKAVGEAWQATSKDEPAQWDTLATKIEKHEKPELDMSDVKEALAAARSGLVKQSLERSAKFAAVASKLDEVARQAAPKEIEPEAAAIVARLEPLVESLFPWPMAIVLSVVIGIALVTARSGPGVALLARVQNLKLGEVFSLSLTEQQNKADVEGALAGFQRLVRKGHDEAISKSEVDAKLGKVVKKLEPWLASNAQAPQKLASVRFTLHVPSPFFEGYLYQLVDYHKYQSKDLQIETRGRMLSQRFGLIGRAWRKGESNTEGSIPTTTDMLIERWGMTQSEAREKATRQSMSATVLCSRTKALAIFYMDSEASNAFDLKGHPSSALSEQVETLAADEGLIDALAKMDAELRGMSIPTFRLHR